MSGRVGGRETERDREFHQFLFDCVYVYVLDSEDWPVRHVFGAVVAEASARPRLRLVSRETLGVPRDSTQV